MRLYFTEVSVLFQLFKTKYLSKSSLKLTISFQRVLNGIQMVFEAVKEIIQPFEDIIMVSLYFLLVRFFGDEIYLTQEAKDKETIKIQS